jgi:hypothetical protein
MDSSATEEARMAVGVLIALPGVTQEQYEQVTAKIFGQYPMNPSDAPDGCYVHSAGPHAGGWYVYDIWESKEHFARFGEEKIGPAMAEVLGGEGPPPTPEFFEVSNFVVAS